MLSRAEQEMNTTAIHLSRNYRENESNLIMILIGAIRTQYFRRLDHPGLCDYIEKRLGFEGNYVYMLKRVATGGSKFASLESALRDKRLSVSKADRVVPVMTNDNQTEIVEFACTHSYAQVDAFIAGMNCSSRFKDTMKLIGTDQWRWTIDMTTARRDHLERIQAIEAQGNRPSTRLDALHACMDVFSYHKDKVKKAERAHERKQQQQPPDEFVAQTPPAPPPPQAPGKHKRVRLTAEQEHAIFLRDGGRCTYKDKAGVRCNRQFYTASHHVHFVSHGGTNAIDNMQTLCWHHHDLIHQTEFQMPDSEENSNPNRSPLGP